MSLQVRVGEQILAEGQVIPLLAQYQLLPRLAQELIIDQAIAETPGLVCTQEEIQGAITQFAQQRQFKSEDELKMWLQNNGLQADQLPAIASRPLLIEKFKQQRWGADNLEAFFIDRKSQLDRIVYSLIRTSDSGIAQELYFRILDGESTFAELSRQYSEGAEAQTGGLVGPVEMSVPHPGIAKLLTTARPGEIKPPVKIGEWFVLLRLEKLIPAKLDDAMKQRLIHEQFELWLQKQVQETVSFQHTERPEKQ